MMVMMMIMICGEILQLVRKYTLKNPRTKSKGKKVYFYIFKNEVFYFRQTPWATFVQFSLSFCYMYYLFFRHNPSSFFVFEIFKF